MTTRRRVDHTRTSRIVLTGLWADAVLVMAASAYNGGLAFAALGQHIAEGIALGLAVDVGLAVALVGDRALHLAGRQSHWGRALRVSTAVMSLALNCAVQLWLGHYGVAVFHAFLPVLLVLLSEYAQDSTLQFGEIAAAVKAEREAQLAADRAAWEAKHEAAATRTGMTPIPPTASPAFRAVPVTPSSAQPAATPAGGPPPVGVGRPDLSHAGRSTFTPAVHPAGRPESRPADQPADRAAGRPATPARTGPPDRPSTTTQRRTTRTRKRTGTPRTDQQLAAGIRELTKRNGGRPPSQYQLRQALGVGGPRAARLLAELDLTPTGPPASNGAATRKEATP